MHSQLTQEKRCQMEALVSTGAKQAVIAAILDVHRNAAQDAALRRKAQEAPRRPGVERKLTRNCV